MKKYNKLTTDENNLITTLNKLTELGYRILTVVPKLVLDNTQIYIIIYETGDNTRHFSTDTNSQMENTHIR